LTISPAFAVWCYCRESARIIFSESLGDPLADRLLKSLKEAGPDGLTATQQSQVLSGHTGRQQIAGIRDELEHQGLAVTRTVRTSGRPVTLTIAAEHAKEAKEAGKGEAELPPDPTDEEVNRWAAEWDEWSV
jgi:hypothetical protein